MKGVFITGTDTGVGKTLVSAGLVSALARTGRKVAGLKPVASGSTFGPNGDIVWEDVESLRAAGGVGLPLTVMAPYRFHGACSPDIAARLEGREIQLPQLLQAQTEAYSYADWLVIEGVGGLRVPLGPTLDVAHWIRESQLPALVVVPIRLGCINHAVLTFDVLGEMNIPVQGWVANLLDGSFPFVEDTLTTLSGRLGAPLARLPAISETNLASRAGRAAEYLQVIVERLDVRG